MVTGLLSPVQAIGSHNAPLWSVSPRRPAQHPGHSVTPCLSQCSSTHSCPPRSWGNTHRQASMLSMQGQISGCQDTTQAQAGFSSELCDPAQPHNGASALAAALSTGSTPALRIPHQPIRGHHSWAPADCCQAPMALSPPFPAPHAHWTPTLRAGPLAWSWEQDPHRSHSVLWE